MAKRFAYLDGQKLKRKEAEKISGTERLEMVYVRKETLRAVWRQLDRGRSGNMNELIEDLLLRWLGEQERRSKDQ